MTQPVIRGAIVPVTSFQQNCTLLWDDATKQAAVVDPGGNVARILEAIDKVGITVEKILLTHGHIDHAGGAAALRDALRAKRPGTAIPIEGPDLRDKFLLDTLDEQGRRVGMTDARAVTPDRWLVEGDTVSVGPHVFQVLHCPGHTPGHVVFYNAPARFVHVGDVLFQGSIGRTDFPYGDHAALLRAIAEKLLPLGDNVRFICGHGPGSTIGAERANNPFLR
jgi:glyoxylase-like metal-dependent hydrolase (beta-lactamase superfamily II)